MAVPLPAHVSSLLQKLAIVDTVLGVVMIGAGLAWFEPVVPYGVGLVLMSVAMFIWARSQRPRDQDPHARYR